MGKELPKCTKRESPEESALQPLRGKRGGDRPMVQGANLQKVPPKPRSSTIILEEGSTSRPLYKKEKPQE